ncbi:unnamed protein product [Staurois parvus]|uniref:Olfactory receptor n=1 Tax=Staurois parvus TaxID=386267 RepID=A0ABN9EJC8_9NEOB|nr:unnamed protein product [Staurois parvus]
MLTLIGNLALILLISVSPSLKTPMYFFLCNLSSLDIIYTSVSSPKLIHIFATNNGRISFTECILQLFFFVSFWNTEYFLLTVMSYDRYVAICKPLHYKMIMNWTLCTIAAGTSYLGNAINPLMFALLTSKYSFCHSDQIDHFFCEIRSLLALSSSNTSSIEMVLFVEDICLVFFTFLMILTSYVCIIYAVFKVRTFKGRRKAFSSCSSHLMTVMLFYGPIIFLYIKPETEHSKEQDKVLSLLYVAVVPMLNPFVYTLRNMEVIGAIRKVMHIR